MLTGTIRTTIKSAQTRTSPYATRTFQLLTKHKRIRTISRPASAATPIATRRRYASQRSTDRWGPAREAYREHPILFPFAFVCLGVCALAGVFTFHHLWTKIIPIDERYPKEVAAKLKRGFHFAFLASPPEPQKSIDYYLEGIKLAIAHGMHPFSKEVLGIKIKIGEVLEKFQEYDKEIEVFGKIKDECERFLDQAGDDLAAQDRSRLLAVQAQCCLKQGQLYGNDAVQNSKSALEAISQAIEIILTEEKRREELGIVSVPGDEWLDGQQIGASFEQMANEFESRSIFNVAAPLYLRALMHSPKNCHSVVLMNNLAQSLAQTQPDSGIDMTATRETFIENARSWAQKALDTAAAITPPERDEECDISCAVATHNMGEFAEMQQRFDEATRWYREARSLAKALAFKEGVKNADLALERVIKLKTQ